MFYSVLVFSFGMYYSVLVFSSHDNEIQANTVYSFIFAFFMTA